MLIGEPSYLRRGFGKAMIALMLEKLGSIGVKTVIAQPEKENIASNRSLEANGFMRQGEDYVLNLQEDKM